MANYTDRNKLNVVHGEVWVNKWADTTNSGNVQVLNDRIDYFAAIATDYVNGRLRFTRYAVPFGSTAVPRIVEFITTLLCGVLLYDARRERGTSEKGDEVIHKRKEFARLIRQILNGQLKLEHPISGELLGMDFYTAPTVVADLDYACSQTCHGDQCWCTNCIDLRSLLPYNCGCDC